MTFLIWDFDGTLADSFAAIRSAMTAAFTENGLAPVADAQMQGVIGLGLSIAIGQLLEEVGADPGLLAATVDSYKTAWLRPDGAPIVLFDGIAALLKDLAAGGVPMAIATGKGQRGATRALDELGIADYFDPVVTVDDVQHGKPDPEMVLLACTVRGVPPTGAVVIGDTDFDIEMGRRAGATTIAVTWGNHPVARLLDAQPSRVVHSVEELRSVVGGLDGPAAVLDDQ